MTSPKKNFKPKTKKNFFHIKLEDFRIRRGVELFTSSIGWRVMELQTWVKRVARALLTSGEVLL